MRVLIIAVLLQAFICGITESDNVPTLFLRQQYYKIVDRRVCGSDGITYRNLKEFRMMKQRYPYLRIVNKGPCVKVPYYDPYTDDYSTGYEEYDYYEKRPKFYPDGQPGSPPYYEKRPKFNPDGQPEPPPYYENRPKFNPDEQPELPLYYEKRPKFNPDGQPELTPYYENRPKFNPDGQPEPPPYNENRPKFNPDGIPESNAIQENIPVPDGRPVPERSTLGPDLPGKDDFDVTAEEVTSPPKKQFELNINNDAQNVNNVNIARKLKPLRMPRYRFYQDLDESY